MRFHYILGFFFLLVFNLHAQVFVNLQIDAEREDADSLVKLTDELEKRDITTTVFVSGSFSNKYAPVVNLLYRKGFEIALHGYNSGEQLDTMKYDEQKELLARALKAVQGCQPCGTYRPVIGFRPQYFSQNEDTYKILNELGIKYNCGFKAGISYMQGHKNDTQPYFAQEHSFWAVPISTVEYKDELIYLCDISSALAKEIKGEEWGSLIKLSLDKAIEQKRPLIVIIHGWYTGNDNEYDYWQPFLNFLDYAEEKGAKFVSTSKLVNLYSSRTALEPSGKLATVWSNIKK